MLPFFLSNSFKGSFITSFFEMILSICFCWQCMEQFPVSNWSYAGWLSLICCQTFLTLVHFLKIKNQGPLVVTFWTFCSKSPLFGGTNASFLLWRQHFFFLMWGTMPWRAPIMLIQVLTMNSGPEYMYIAVVEVHNFNIHSQFWLSSCTILKFSCLKACFVSSHLKLLNLFSGWT